jgi:drug/metabolite transporter (DMT)-like permease
VSAAHRGIALSLTAAFWAALFLIPYKAAAGAAPRPIVVLAMLTAAAALNTVAALATAGRRLRFDRTAVVASLALAVCTVAGNLGVAESLARVQPAVTSVVLQTQIFFVAAGSALFLAERIGGRLIAGSLLAVVGFAVMQAPWSAAGGDPGGAAWAVLAAISFAAMLVITRRVIDRIDVVAVNALRLWMAVAFMAALPGNAAGALALGGETWLLCAAAAACGPTLSRLLLMVAVRHISASHTKLVTLVSPVFALVMGAIAFGTLPSGREIGGGAVILFGVALPILELVGRSRSAV